MEPFDSVYAKKEAKILAELSITIPRIPITSAPGSSMPLPPFSSHDNDSMRGTSSHFRHGSPKSSARTLSPNSHSLTYTSRALSPAVRSSHERQSRASINYPIRHDTFARSKSAPHRSLSPNHKLSGFFHAGNNENNTGNIQTDGNGAHITPLSAISRSKLLEINSKGPGSVKNLVHFFSSKASDTGSVSDASEYTNGTNLRGDNVSLYSYKSASTNSSPRTARDIISNNRSENNMIAKKYRELAKAKMIQDQLTAAENRRIEEERMAYVMKLREESKLNGTIIRLTPRAMALKLEREMQLKQQNDTKEIHMKKIKIFEQEKEYLKQEERRRQLEALSMEEEKQNISKLLEQERVQAALLEQEKQKLNELIEQQKKQAQYLLDERKRIAALLIEDRKIIERTSFSNAKRVEEGNELSEIVSIDNESSAIFESNDLPSLESILKSHIYEDKHDSAVSIDDNIAEDVKLSDEIKEVDDLSGSIDESQAIVEISNTGKHRAADRMTVNVKFASEDEIISDSSAYNNTMDDISDQATQSDETNAIDPFDPASISSNPDTMHQEIETTTSLDDLEVPAAVPIDDSNISELRDDAVEDDKMEQTIPDMSAATEDMSEVTSIEESYSNETSSLVEDIDKNLVRMGDNIMTQDSKDLDSTWSSNESISLSMQSQEEETMFEYVSV